MSVRYLTNCLIPAALLAVALVTHVLAPRVSLRAGDGVACPQCQECPRQDCTAQPACSEKMETRIYQVADLVLPCGNAAAAPCPIPAAPACTTATAPCPAAPRAANVQLWSSPPTTEEELIKLIVHTVAPESWAEKGGKGTIDYFPATMTLVVNQTHDVHTQIADLFKAMRQHQDVQVAFEVRFVSVMEGLYEQLQDKFGIEAQAAPADGVRVSFLDEKQVSQILESVQSDGCSNIMQAPKLTMFNGQCATLDITDQKTFVTGMTLTQQNGQAALRPQHEVVSTGVRMSVQPVVSADRRFVRVCLNANLSSLDSPEADLIPIKMEITPKVEGKGKAEPVIFTQFIQNPRLNTITANKMLAIPEGCTAVLSCWKRTQERCKDDTPPAVKDIPILNEVFKSTKLVRETECFLMMVTPRIIVAAEEEEDAFDEVNGLCWPFGDEPLPCPSTGCCKDKNNQDGAVRPAVKVLDPQSPNGCRDSHSTVTEQNTGSCQIGAGVTADAGCTGSIINERNFDCEVAELLVQYRQACAAGRRAEATELAVKALALDPACFHKAACKSEK